MLHLDTVLAMIYQRTNGAIRFCDFGNEVARARADLFVVDVLAYDWHSDSFGNCCQRRLRGRDDYFDFCFSCYRSRGICELDGLLS
jgi:hypothetical protein